MLGLTLQGRQHLADIHKRMAPSACPGTTEQLTGSDIVMDQTVAMEQDGDDEWVEEADEDGMFAHALQDIIDST